MYPQELEQLIDSILADGVITATERHVLHKKAANFGIDADEIDVYIDGKLQLKQSQKPKSQKFGEVAKCPQCGTPVPAGAGKCPECGFEFRGLEANRSSEKLADKLEAVMAKYSSTDDKSEMTTKNLVSNLLGTVQSKNAMYDEMATVIRNFPIPVDKDTLLEFMLSLQPRIGDRFLNEKTRGNDKKLGEAYYHKFKETVNKASILFPGDASFTNIIKQAKQEDLKNRLTSSKFITLYIVAAIILFFIISEYI